MGEVIISFSVGAKNGGAAPPTGPAPNPGNKASEMFLGAC